MIAPASTRAARLVALTELFTAVPQHAVRVERISNWTVGEHVQHCALTIRAIRDALSRSRPPAPRSWRGFLGRFALAWGRIPRGRAAAPEAVRPREALSEDALIAGLEAAVSDVQVALALEPDRWFAHFAFGVLPRDRALRFLEVHNRHHLRIIRDILRAS